MADVDRNRWGHLAVLRQSAVVEVDRTWARTPPPPGVASLFLVAWIGG